MSLESAPSQWLANSLSTLLGSPHVHVPTTEHVHLPGGGHVHVGPGPVDLFSTRFDNLFMDDVTGIVAGRPVDRQGLYDSLLGLQSRWNPDTARFVDNALQEGLDMALTMEWTPADTVDQMMVAAEASLADIGGVQRISSIRLDGDETIFYV